MSHWTSLCADLLLFGCTISYADSNSQADSGATLNHSKLFSSFSINLFVDKCLGGLFRFFCRGESYSIPFNFLYLFHIHNFYSRLSWFVKNLLTMQSWQSFYLIYLHLVTFIFLRAVCLQLGTFIFEAI